MSEGTTFAGLDVLARHLRDELESKQFILLYAYNGTGKTRLSTAFKNLGRTVNPDGATERPPSSGTVQPVPQAEPQAGCDCVRPV